MDKARTVVTSRKTTLDHSDPLTWLARMAPSARDILFGSAAAGVFDREALEETLDLVLGDGPPARPGPVAAIGLRIRRHRAAATLRKALQFQLWREWSGVTAL